MTNKPIRAALLGGGLFAVGAYLPSVVGAPSISLAGVWSRSEASARKLESKGKELGLEFAASFGEDALSAILADKTITAVILVLPITTQPDLVRRAWRAGKHVMSEKPLGRDVAEARALIAEYEAEWKPKGLVWRVAENWAHEPFLHKARDLLADPAVGSVLYWRMHFEAVIEDGSSWHATTWRTVPDYQGGFILDGGVHWAAMLRTVLTAIAKPLAITAQKSLHRAHILPHDTIVGIVHPAPSATVPAHGAPTAVTTAMPAEDMPVQPGKSTPHGTFVLSWAAPSTPRASLPPNELYIVAQHAVLRILATGASWSITLTPTPASGVAAFTADGPATGVEVELDDFGHAVAAALAGVPDDRTNYGEPAGALWDLSFIEAALESDGKVMVIEK